MKKFNKKGQVLQGLGNLGIGVAGIAIVLVVTFLIMAQAKTQVGDIEGIDETNVTQCQGSSACNATDELTSAIATIPGWVSLIIITVIGGLLLGLVAVFQKRG